MNFKISVFMAVACLALGGGFANGFGSIDFDSNLLSYMSRSNELLQQNPARSLECFNYYIPLINKLAEQYEWNYKACLNLTEVGRAYADNATLDERNNLANAAAASCDLLSKCGDSDSVSNIFQCYIDGGSANINTMYLINANASEQLANLKEQYHLIENEEYRCTNDTKRAYEKDSAAAYESLNNCILGNSDIPTAAPSTTTTASTSNAPTSSNGPSTTNAPTTSNSSTTNEDGPSTETDDPSTPTEEPTS